MRLKRLKRPVKLPLDRGMGTGNLGHSNKCKCDCKVCKNCTKK